MHLSLKGWENVLFELGGERVTGDYSHSYVARAWVPVPWVGVALLPDRCTQRGTERNKTVHSLYYHLLQVVHGPAGSQRVLPTRDERNQWVKKPNGQTQWLQAILNVVAYTCSLVYIRSRRLGRNFAASVLLWSFSSAVSWFIFILDKFRKHNAWQIANRTATDW